MKKNRGKILFGVNFLLQLLFPLFISLQFEEKAYRRRRKGCLHYTFRVNLTSFFVNKQYLVSSDPPWKDGNARYTLEPFQALVYPL